jgi:hypothetical protein
MSEGIHGHRYYGFEEDPYGIVESNFADWAARSIVITSTS